MIYHILLDVGWFASKGGRQADVDAAARDDSVVRRASQGDSAALVSLYRAHAAEVRTFALRLLGCEMAADDLLHEVFLALPSALSRFRGDCPLRSYLLSITTRSARRHLRAAQRRRRLEARAAEQPVLAMQRPDANSERRELAALLNQALDALPLAQRVAFVLCEIEERSSQEAGEILGERAGTIRARVFHAKRKLRERLEELAPAHTASQRSEVGA